jgi:hypothetical protein
MTMACAKAHAECARHGRGTGGESPLGALTEGTPHRRQGLPREGGPMEVRWCGVEPSESEALNDSEARGQPSGRSIRETRLREARDQVFGSGETPCGGFE